MATPESEMRGNQRRDGAAQAHLENFTREIRKHGLTASTVALVLAIAGMGHNVPGISVVAAVALLFLAPVAGGLRGPTPYAVFWLAILGLSWGMLGAVAMHSNPPLVAIACVVGAWMVMMPSFLHVPTASAIWTFLCLGPIVVASLFAYDDVAAIGGAVILIGAGGHLISSRLRLGLEQAGALSYDKQQLEQACDWLQKRAAAAEGGEN